MIGITDEPDDSSTENDFFSINEENFDIIMATHQNEVISLNIIVKDISLLINKDSQ